MSAVAHYLAAVERVLQHIARTQLEAIDEATRIWAPKVARGGLVLTFATGHSRIAVEEAFPRYGSYPAFFPMVELSLTYHTQVVGSNGQRQAMFLEQVPGLGRVIWQNFHPGPDDALLCISHSGTGAAVVELAREARAHGLHVTAITSLAHSRAAAPHPAVGQRLFEVADLVLDTGVPPGDAAVEIPGWSGPVGPVSTVAAATLINLLKCRLAERLADLGSPLPVLTSALLVGEEASRESFTQAYEAFWRRSRHL